MEKYYVSVFWAESAVVEIEAESLEEAIKLAQEGKNVPEHGDYIDDSFQIDLEATEELNEEM